MKILFDTNVIISGFVSYGHCCDVIKNAVNKHEVYCTEYLLNETRENLFTKFTLSHEAVDSIIGTVKKQFIKGETACAVEEVSRDPKDNQVLADAAINNIDIIITGDKDLLVLKRYKGVKIVSPQDYWKL